MTGTTNLNLTLPTVGADSDVWGNELNAGLTTLDALLASALSGITLSTAGSSATFGIAAGCASGMKLASAYTKTTSAWAVGTAAGSLDTGSIANSTWYHVWLIMRPDTGIVDVLVSLSATAPTMPASYTFKRRIGAMKTNGSAQWVKFIQLGDLFLWDLAVANDINFNPTTSVAAKVVNVPTGLNVIAKLRGWCQTGASETTGFLIFSPSEAGVTSISLSNSYMTCFINSGAGTVGVSQGYAVDILTDTSAQVNVIGVGTSVSSLIRTQAYGWVDPRGKW